MKTHERQMTIPDRPLMRDVSAAPEVPVPPSVEDDPVLRALPWLSRFPRRDRRPGAFALALKRSLDIALVLLAAPVVLPLMLGCSIALKLESLGAGVFYRQMRTGRHGQRFRMFKFRTMVANADELKEQVAHLNQLQWPDFKIDDDPRVTRVGRFLRRSSLDELPQVLNVLRGEMSLVGPRPTSFRPETYSEWHKRRLAAVPGITGLWQIVGRGSMEFDERVLYDVAYIERQSLALDIEILLRTVGTVLGGKGVH